MENKNIAIIQARMGSTRFPGKSLIKIAYKPLIWHVIYRLKQSKKISKFYLATSVSPENDDLEAYASMLGAEVFRGSEENVFSRFENIILRTKPSTITRVCGDCPLIDISFIDRVIDIIEQEGVDYVKADKEKSIHQGIDIVSINLFNKILPFKEDPRIKEHVFNFKDLKLKSVKFGFISLEDHEYGIDARLSIDTPSDLKFMRKLYRNCNASAGKLTSNEYVKEIKNNPKLTNINSHVYQKTADQKTSRVNFLYAEKLGLRMFTLARQYVEYEGIGVRFIVKKDLKKLISPNDFIGVLDYRNERELKDIIQTRSSDFLIGELLPNKTLSKMKLKAHSYLEGNLVKYEHVDSSITK